MGGPGAPGRLLYAEVAAKEQYVGCWRRLISGPGAPEPKDNICVRRLKPSDFGIAIPAMPALTSCHKVDISKFLGRPSGIQLGVGGRGHPVGAWLDLGGGARIPS